jgi:hypothetical protein
MTPPTGARRWVLVPGTATQDNLRRYRLMRLEAIAFADADAGAKQGQAGARSGPVPPGSDR